MDVQAALMESLPQELKTLLLKEQDSTILTLETLLRLEVALIASIQLRLTKEAELSKPLVSSLTRLPCQERLDGATLTKLSLRTLMELLRDLALIRGQPHISSTMSGLDNALIRQTNSTVLLVTIKCRLEMSNLALSLLEIYLTSLLESFNTMTASLEV